MGAKNKRGQVELFDGHAVEKYTAKIVGSFDADEINSENLSFDDHVCLIVTARVGAAKIDSDKNAELYRENSLKVLRAVQITPELAEKALQLHSQGTTTPQLPLLNTNGLGQTVVDANGVIADDDDDGAPREETYASVTSLRPQGDKELNNFIDGYDE